MPPPTNLIDSQSLIPPDLTPPLAQFQINDTHSSPYSFDLPLESLEPHSLRLIHAFAPIFLFHELAEIVSYCETQKVHSIHVTFFFNAFNSLSAAASTGKLSTPPPQQAGWYTAAQQQAMQAYFTLISGENSVVGRDACYTAAGLIYLAIHAIFTHGWGKETSTWLRFAVDVIESIPLTSSTDLGFQCWLARIVWLWDKALTCCEPELPSALTSTSSSIYRIIRDSSSLNALKFDEEQRNLSTFIELCMDLEYLSANVGTDLSAANGLVIEGFGAFANLPASAVPSLCQRVQAWVKSCPIAQDLFLHFDTDFGSDDAAHTSLGRVLHIVYYSMVIKLDNVDRVRCGLRKTSLVTALVRIIDAADWIVTTRQLYLWSFAERALHFAKDYLLSRFEHAEQTISPALQVSDSAIQALSQPPPMDICTTLSLIKDVFMEAHSILDPITANAQRASAERAVESISNFLHWKTSTKPGTFNNLSSSEIFQAGLQRF